MAKLYFRYGAMNSAKTANLLMVAHNYTNQGKKVIIIKPDKDTRWGMTVEVKSRAIVDPQEAITVSDSQDIMEIVKEEQKKQTVSAILVEEAQFLSKTHVRQLALIVDELNIPVLCYGLRCSYIDSELFEGSAALLYWADTIEEIKNVCLYCSSKATKTLLRINGVPQYRGEQVIMGDVVGDEIVFTPVCRRHYLNPPPMDAPPMDAQRSDPPLL